jgi:hypothetical protein
MENNSLLNRRALFSGHRGFFQQHDGNFVSNGINTSAGRALEPTTISGQGDRRLALRANQNFEQIFRDSQLRPPRGFTANVRTVSKAVKAEQT